jgi:hypothetical protein
MNEHGAHRIVLNEGKLFPSTVFLPELRNPLKMIFIPNDTRTQKLHTNACFAQPAYIEHVISVLKSVYAQ